jgi:quinol monooxygenase YgiN
MYSMTGKLTAKAGKRSELTAILLRAADGVSDIPECLAYIVLEDLHDKDAVWVFEMWDTQQAHDDSLKDEQTRALIAEAMPILAGAPSGSELRVMGGHGTPSQIPA